MNPPSSPRRGLSKWLALLAIPLAAATSEGLGWWWMHPPADMTGVRLLEYAFPSGRYGFYRRAMDDRVSEILSCSSGQTGTIDAGLGRRIDVNYFEWDNTDVTGLADAFGHQPEICMGNAGMQVEKFLPNREYRMDGADLFFDSTLFRDESGAPLHIYKLSWAEGMDGQNLLRDGPTGLDFRKFKFQAVADRWRPRFARVLMLGVFGATSEEEAWKLVRLNVLEDLHLKLLDEKP